MTPDSPAALRGVEMSDRETDQFLRERGVGVLPLTDGSEAYGVPISFRVRRGVAALLRLPPGRRTEQEGGVRRGDRRASLTAFAIDSKHDWRSVVVSGPLRRVADDEWDTVVGVLEDNAWYPSLFSEADPMQGFQGWELRIDEVSGLASDG